MTALQVIIYRDKKTAHFTGSGTFSAKEVIKTLGSARFDRESKCWEVKNFHLTVEELSGHFPGIVVEEITVSGAPATAQAPTVSTREAPTSNLPTGLSVTEFLDRARNAIRSAFPSTFCIYGILSDVKNAAGGRVFMELKEGPESDDRVKCVIWDNAEAKCAKLRDAGFSLETELQVMFEVSVTLNKRGAQVSLTVERIIPEYTIGKLAALREQTNERLKKEGLFDQNKKLQLPFLPRRLGILTSAGGTVINDFMASLNVANFGFELFWMNVSVQGSEAKRSILKGLNVMSRAPALDALLIFRGGGSQAELAIFNDYDIARAVCVFPLPVISAIGHQEDQCSVQDVSMHGLGVPKDVGRFFADIVIGYRERFLKSISFVSTLASRSILQTEKSLEVHSRSVAKFLGQVVSSRQEGTKRMEDSLPLLAASALRSSVQRFLSLASPVSALGLGAAERGMAKIERVGQQVYHQASKLQERSLFRLQHTAQLGRELHRVIEQREARVSAYGELFDTLRPETQLKRGFALVQRKNSSYVTAAVATQSGEEVMIVFHDGEKPAKII